MITRILSSTLLLAIAWSDAGAAPGIYRCGSSYSQIPCANGQEIKVDDARDAAQKQVADENTRRNAAAARALEKDRLAQEKQALAAAHSPKAKLATPAPAEQPAEPITKITPKRLAPGSKKSNDFVAQVPGTGSVKKPKSTAKRVKTPDPV